MIPLFTREAVRELDRQAIEDLGVPGLVLMENAGRGATEAMVARLGEHLERVVIVCGTGQNGGDGWVVARHLLGRGHHPVGILVGDESRVRGDARVNLDAARALGIEVRVLAADHAAELSDALQGATLVVDALFGTGLDRPIAGGYAMAVEHIDACAAPCVALDLPSGVDADTGAILGTAPHAALTVTFAAHKRGLHQYPAVAHAGEVVLTGIGVPAPGASEVALLQDGDISGWLPPRAGDAHKGSAGHVLIVAGAPGRTGAALLSGLGALRAGAGLATLAARGAARAALDGKVVELMTAELPETAVEAAREVGALVEGKRSAAVGPGLGLGPEDRALALALARDLPVPAVLDADALTALAEGGGPSAVADAAAPRGLTPHPGEAARLLGSTSGAIQADRYGAATRLAAESGQVVVLKGARTVIAGPDGRVRVCPCGTPALGVAGTGDVLTGVIAALLGTLPPLDAASAGVYLHALAGELAARADRGLLAGEVAGHLPDALARCRSGR